MLVASRRSGRAPSTIASITPAPTSATRRSASPTAGSPPRPRRAAHGPTRSANTTENRNYFAFGCATQQNLAAIVDNPLDLLYPRGLTPADAHAPRRRPREVPQGRDLLGRHSQRDGRLDRPGSRHSMTRSRLQDIGRARSGRRCRGRPPSSGDVAAGPAHLDPGVLRFARARRGDRGRRRRPAHGARPRQGPHRRHRRRGRVLPGAPRRPT